MIQAATKKGRPSRKPAKAAQLKRYQGVIIAFLIVSILLFAAQLFINPIAKTLVTRETNSLFGDKLKIESVRVSLWRGALIAKGVQLIQPPGYGAGNLLTTERLEIRINLIALLKKELAVNSMIVKSPRINLIQSANSQLNTEYYLALFKSKTDSNAATKSPNSFTFNLKRFQIDKGELLLNSYQLSQGRPTFEFKNIKLGLKNICLPNPNQNSSPFAVSGIVGAGRPAKFQVDGQVVLAAAALKFQAHSKLEGLELADYTYLFPKSAITVNSGRAWVDADTSCVNNYIVSKQQATVKDLKVKAKKGHILSATFLGLPATAITKILANKGYINFDFTVQGYTNDLKANPKEIIGSAVSKGLHAKFGGGIPKAGQMVGGGIEKVGAGIKNSVKKIFKYKK